MLKITPVGRVGSVQRFRLDGRLAGLYVAELSRVLQPSLETPSQVELDVQGLTFVDSEGASFLKDLIARKVEIRGCSAFVAQLLGLP
jgi:ABC-type transporter Mla MlaB component